MASIVSRNNKFSVVYLYDAEDGKRKQKWETYKTLAEAKRRKAEIEYKTEIGTLAVPTCKTLKDLLDEYIVLYGKTTWAISTYGSNISMINNYILPIIGSMKLTEITARVLEKYYMSLLKTPAVHKITQKKGSKKVEYVTPATVKKIHNILRS